MTRNAILKNSSLFDGIGEEQYDHVLKCLQASEVTIRRGSIVQHISDIDHKAGIVLRGKVKILYYDESSNPVILRVREVGESFGMVENAEITGQRLKNQIEILAMKDSDILLMKPMDVSCDNRSLCRFYSQIVANLLREALEHNAYMDMRLRVMGQRSIRDKLKIYLGELPERSDGTRRIPFSMSDLANFLNVDRSALYQVIRSLKEEGAVHWEGRLIDHLKPSMF